MQRRKIFRRVSFGRVGGERGIQAGLTYCGQPSPLVVPASRIGAVPVNRTAPLPHYGVKSNGAVASIGLNSVLEEDGAACVTVSPVNE